MQRPTLWFPLLFLVLLPQFAFTQQVLKGRVLDAKTHEGLPFVNVLGPEKTGALADIDGRFELRVKSFPVTLTFSVLGHQSKVVNVSSADELKVELQPLLTDLKEVVILPTDNPAWRIIRQASANRKMHDPEEDHTFSCNSYNKMFLTLDPDEVNSKESMVQAGDSNKMREFLASQYLFFSETYATRNYVSKLLDKETITATKVSGFSNPTFGMLASQFQSFSFYTDLITISDKAYLNPLTNNSEYKYRFEIVDTAYSNSDTVFIITFTPKKGKNFDALEGKLYINSADFALQQVVAEPVVRKEGQFHAKIQQQYKQVGNVWFPEQLNTFLSFQTSPGNKGGSGIIGEIRSYISDIKLDPGLKRKDAKGIDNDIATDAGKKDSLFWNTVRISELTAKERNTYRVIDSVSKEENIETKFKLFSYLIGGQIPYGPVSFILNDLVSYNNVEGFRLGLGVATNDRISKYFAVGGAFAYGTKDSRFKFRGDAKLFLVKDDQLTLSFQYLKDLEEPGLIGFPRVKVGLAASENLRKLVLNRMDEIESYQLAIKYKPATSLTLEPFYKYQYRQVSGYDYQYATSVGDNISVLRNNFLTEQIGINWRLAIGEKFSRVFGHVLPMPSKYPVVQGRIYNNGLISSSDYPFTAALAQLDHRFKIKLLGEVSYRINAGYVDKVAPYPYLFNGRANLGSKKLSVNSFGSFETMRMNEFLSDRYVSANVYYDLKNLLFKLDNFKPGFILVGSGLWGQLRDNGSHKEIAYTVPKKGFFESGLMVTNLYKSFLSSIGVGVFYRFGAYQLPGIKDNFAFKINAVYSLD